MIIDSRHRAGSIALPAAAAALVLVIVSSRLSATHLFLNSPFHQAPFLWPVVAGRLTAGSLALYVLGLLLFAAATGLIAWTACAFSAAVPAGAVTASLGVWFSVVVGAAVSGGVVQTVNQLHGVGYSRVQAPGMLISYLGAEFFWGLLYGWIPAALTAWLFVRVTGRRARVGAGGARRIGDGAHDAGPIRGAAPDAAPDAVMKGRIAPAIVPGVVAAVVAVLVSGVLTSPAVVGRITFRAVGIELPLVEVVRPWAFSLGSFRGIAGTPFALYLFGLAVFAVVAGCLIWLAGSFSVRAASGAFTTFLGTWFAVFAAGSLAAAVMASSGQPGGEPLLRVLTTSLGDGTLWSLSVGWFPALVVAYVFVRRAAPREPAGPAPR